MRNVRLAKDPLPAMGGFEFYASYSDIQHRRPINFSHPIGVGCSFLGRNTGRHMLTAVRKLFLRMESDWELHVCLV